MKIAGEFRTAFCDPKSVISPRHDPDIQ